MPAVTLTLDQIRETADTALKQLIVSAGNPSHLARMLNVPVSTVHGWSQRGRISIRGALLVEQCPHLDYTAKQLRPDIEFS